MKVNINLNNHLFIFLITGLLLSSNWIFSFSVFPNEDINLRVINEINDTSYFPLIKSFGDFNLNPSYQDGNDSLKLISFPALSLLVDIFFFKIFGSYSFIIIEFVSVFIFINIFYYIFRTIDISKQLSLLFSLLLFIFPSFIDQIAFLDNNFIQKLNLNISKFYGLRNPRPLITNLYLFISLYYFIKIFYLEDKKLSTYIILGTIIGLTLHAFFYFFLFQSVLFLILYLKNHKLNIIKSFFADLKKNLIFISVILFFVTVLVLQLYLSEPDYKARLGIFHMNFDKKKLMFEYIINFFSKIEFIILFLLTNFMYFFVKKNPINIFYYLFLSTIISTIIFITFYPTSIDYYFFFNWILLSGTLFVIISFFILANKYLFVYWSNNKKFIFSTSFIVLIVLFFNYLSLKNKFIDKNSDVYRSDLNKVINFINSDKILSNKTHNILTLNYNTFIWLIFNNYKNFSIVPNSFWTAKKNSTIENELISTFKLFKLPNNDFNEFFKNKKKGYRYTNQNTRLFFDRLYLANKVHFFSDLSDFEEKHQLVILKTSPLYSHQIIIPSNEFKRLKKKFDFYKKKISPTVIILDSKDAIINKQKLNKNNYCLRYINNEFKVYVSYKVLDFCKLTKN